MDQNVSGTMEGYESRWQRWDLPYADDIASRRPSRASVRVEQAGASFTDDRPGATVVQRQDHCTAVAANVTNLRVARGAARFDPARAGRSAPWSSSRRSTAPPQQHSANTAHKSHDHHDTDPAEACCCQRHAREGDNAQGL